MGLFADIVEKKPQKTGGMFADILTEPKVEKPIGLGEFPEQLPDPSGLPIVGATPADKGMQWEAMPKRTISQKIGDFFVGHPLDRPYLPSDAGRREKIEHVIKSVASMPVRTFVKYGKGLMLGAPEVAWAAIKKITPESMWVDEVKNMTLDEAMDWAMGYNPSEFSRSVSGLAEFMGSLKTAKKAFGPMPKSANLFDTALRNGEKWALARAAREASKLSAGVIDPETDYQYDGAGGVLADFGMGVGFSLLSTAAKPVLAAIAKTSAAKAISDAAHRVVLEFTKKFPVLADAVRKNPSAYFTKQILRSAKRSGINTKDLSVEQKIVLKHVAREADRKFVQAMKNYTAPIDRDIVERGPRRRGLQITGEVPPTRLQRAAVKPTGRIVPTKPQVAGMEYVSGQLAKGKTTFSRKDMKDMGIDRKTTAKERQQIFDDTVAEKERIDTGEVTEAVEGEVALPTPTEQKGAGKAEGKQVHEMTSVEFAETFGKASNVQITSSDDYIASSSESTPVTTADGKPITVHHGTSRMFEKFSEKTLGKNTGAPSAKMGFFFASDPETAVNYTERDFADPETVTDTDIYTAEVTADYWKIVKGKRGKQNYEHWKSIVDDLKARAAKQKTTPKLIPGARTAASDSNVREAQLIMKNPKMISMKGRNRTSRYSTEIKKAWKEGHDGIIITNTTDGGGIDTIWVVRNANQIVDIARTEISGRARTKFSNHKAIVESAVERGEHVPLNVLQEYSGKAWADKAIKEFTAQPTPTAEGVVTEPVAADAIVPTDAERVRGEIEVAGEEAGIEARREEVEGIRLREPAEGGLEAAERVVEPTAEAETVEGKVTKPLVNQGEIGQFEEGVFLAEPKEELAKIVETVRKNEGERAAQIVKEIQDAGINTVSTHIDDTGEVTVRTTNLSDENKDILEERGVAIAKFEGVSGDYLSFPTPTAEDPTIDVPSQQGGFVGGRSGRATAKISAIVKEDMSTGSKGADAFLARTKGFTGSGQPGILRQVAGHIRAAVKGFHYLPELPKTKDFANIRESFRRTEEISRLAHDTAVEKMSWAIKPTEGTMREATARMKALEMKIIADDLVEDIGKGVDLPSGMTKDSVAAMKARGDELYEQYPSVREAYDRIRKITQEFGDLLVSEGQLSKEQAKEFYFPHRVIKYLRESDAFLGIPSKKPADYKKGYLKQRKGGHDYSTDIMERLTEHWSQVQRDVDYSRFLSTTLKEEEVNFFEKEHPKWKEFTKAADGTKVRNLVPEGYKEVVVMPGRFYYSANGVTEDMAKAIIAQNLDSIEDMLDDKAASQVRKILAVGRKKSFIVREEIAKQIHKMPTVPISQAPAYLAVKGFNTFVKGQILFNPLYSLPFHVTNLVGDAHKVFVALPSALKGKYLSNYWKEVIAAHKGEKSDRFALAQKYGVVGSGWIGTDLPELETILPTIERAEISGAGKHLVSKTKRLWNITRKIGAGREDWLRYALFDRLMDLGAKGENIIKYATKDSKTLSGITDKNVLAAKIARDIAGDYAAIGRTGRMLSDLVVPFYRWMHLNLPWWPRIAKEYAQKGQYGRLASAIMAASAPYVISAIWNYSDDDRRKYERSLPPWKRWSFHVVSLRGKKMYYVPLPLDDIANFIGLPEHILDFQRYQRGMITGSELAKRIAWNSLYEPAMSIVNAVGGLAGVVRDAVGVTTYPDIQPWLEKRWDRKALNIAGDVFGAPAQLGKAIQREGITLDKDGNVELGQKTKDILNRSWMGIRPYSMDIGQVESQRYKSVYKRTSARKGQVRGGAHKGKQRLVDRLDIQLESQKD